MMVIVALMSCGNTHKNKETKSTNEPVAKDTINLVDKVVIPGSNVPDVNLSKVKKLTQKELKPFLLAYGKENPETKIRIITDFGNITVKLFKDTPLHRANFIRLVKLNYFNTTFFHRVAKGFVIQGGNSDKVLTQRFRAAIGDYLIPSESSPKHKHVRGAFSMSKFLNQNVSDASSPFEFFIVVNTKSATHLNGEHTVFGKVIDGMDVVDKINKVEVGDSEWPRYNVYLDIEIVE